MTTKTASKAALSAATLDFLRDLAQNNNRDWFQVNRARYDAAKTEFEGFITNLLQRINTTQPLGTTTSKDCIFRINRDVRFSKDKSPYKLNLALRHRAGREKLRSDRLLFSSSTQRRNVYWCRYVSAYAR